MAVKIAWPSFSFKNNDDFKRLLDADANITAYVRQFIKTWHS